MRLVDTVKRANRPGPPEDSRPLRVASAAAVVIGIVACAAEGELSSAVAGASIALVTAGSLLSYRTRRRPMFWIKPVLAVSAVAAFAWFFHELVGHTFTDVAAVEAPLAVLFVWIQVAHAFDTPARRDLGFSLAGSASLMAVAGAQAIDLGFGLYALAWMAVCLWGLHEMWRAASGGGRVAVRGALGALAAVVGVTLVVLVALPAPDVSGHIDFPAAAADGARIALPGGLAGDGGGATEPAQPGTPAGRTRVGGYLGFAGRLDTALRGSLGNTLVMRVRAQRPSFWIGETYDTWNGQSWTQRHSSTDELVSGSPFAVPEPDVLPGGTTGAGLADGAGGGADLQTFYIAVSGPDLVFHADEAREVWFPAGSLYVSPADANDTVVSPIGLGRGAIYTVESQVAAPTPAELRRAGTTTDIGTTPGASPVPVPAGSLQLPRRYSRVRALAESITARLHDNYDKVEALIAWIGAHTHYSTDIPPLPPGGDTVDTFLFGNRIGFCEQISTSLAVMLRSLGIPAREAVGYVPGPYDPITDLYEVQARDAHAWVQVWFPGYGWQSFDPTAVVPAANPSPGDALVHDLLDALRKAPPVPLGVTLASGTAIGLVVWRWRRRPATWEEAVTRNIERAGGRAGRPRRAAETLAEYATALDERSGDPSGSWRALAWLIERSAYGAATTSEADRQRALGLSRTMRVARRPVSPASGRAPGRSSLSPRAGVGRTSAGGDG